MLGFRGPSLPKPRPSPVPSQRTRNARQHHRHEAALAELGITDSPTITVIIICHRRQRNVNWILA